MNMYNPSLNLASPYERMGSTMGGPRQAQPNMLSHGGLADVHHRMRALHEPQAHHRNMGGAMPHHKEGHMQDHSHHNPPSRRNKMILAHFSPHELTAMDEQQGSIHRDKKYGIRSYPHLEELLSNPHLMASVHHHAMEHHAHGGEVGHMGHFSEANGMHGDTERAYIGPITRHFLDSYARQSINPRDGHPQYWSLGSFLGGLGNTLRRGVSSVGNAIGGFAQKALPIAGGVARAALPALSQIAGNALQNRYGIEGLGDVASGALNQLGNAGLDQVGATNSPSQFQSAAGNGLSGAVQSHLSGAPINQTIGRAMQTTAQGVQGPYGPALNQTGASLASGQSPGMSALHGAIAGGNSYLYPGYYGSNQ